MKRRRRGKLRRLDRPKRSKRLELVVAHDLEDAVAKAGTQTSKRARLYRWGSDQIVVWHGGKWRLAYGVPARVRSLARPPRGLEERIQIAIREGKRNG